ncbi:Uncharacterised protein [Vibrio cholerae]|nr:Uncharacterised protein [Vibrio cholerae]CSI59546.1 Uncharacterised protein [Vibrio cholerae]
MLCRFSHHQKTHRDKAHLRSMSTHRSQDFHH